MRTPNAAAPASHEKGRALPTSLFIHSSLQLRGWSSEADVVLEPTLPPVGAAGERQTSALKFRSAGAALGNVSAELRLAAHGAFLDPVGENVVWLGRCCPNVDQ
jgi:hypothetical protein